MPAVVLFLLLALEVLRGTAAVLAFVIAVVLRLLHTEPMRPEDFRYASPGSANALMRHEWALLGGPEVGRRPWARDREL